MRQIIVSGDWLFNNVPGYAGYGFKAIGWTLGRINEEKQVFVPLLWVEDIPVVSEPRFLIASYGHYYTSPEEDSARQEASRDRRGRVYGGGTYPPLLPSGSFHLKEQSTELVAVSGDRGDNACLLLFGGDSWLNVSNSTSGRVLKTVTVADKFFGIALLEPGQVITTFRGGWEHTISGYIWDGVELRVLHHTNGQSYRRDMDHILAAGSAK